MNEPRLLSSLSARLALAALFGIGLVMGLTLGLCRLAPTWSWGTVAALVTLVSMPLLFLACRHVVLRGVHAAMMAVSDGLLSLGEGDYSLRLAAGGPDEVATLKTRFNALAASLRKERNDIYQRQIMLETVLQGTSLAVLLVDESKRVVFSNPAARDLLGSRQRLEGQNLELLLGTVPEELKRAAEGTSDLVFTCDAGPEPETYRLIKRYFQLNTQLHTLYLFTPLTKELARKEVETWKTSIRVISHEVNNSLAPISSLVHSARLMLAAPAHAQRLSGALDTIEERASHLRTFLETYASFARLPLPTKSRLTWSELLHGLEGLYPFRIEGDVPAVRFFADRAQLQQVLINLLKNAHEAGGAPEDVALVFPPHPDGGHEVQVVDRGKGMSEEVLRSALLPFYSTKKTGTGLGLALCREIIEAHDGRLALSLRPGGGLVVSCWLP
ncbi:MAG: PAS domain-containing protein [Myxococcales bacterium]|nr:PAS domain-containing protein [Myxococcales bacterium]